MFKPQIEPDQNLVSEHTRQSPNSPISNHNFQIEDKQKCSNHDCSELNKRISRPGMLLGESKRIEAASESEGRI